MHRRPPLPLTSALSSSFLIKIASRRLPLGLPRCRLPPPTGTLGTQRPRPLTMSSSTIKPVFTDKACPPAGPYSQAIHAGNTLYVSGQIPADATGVLVGGSIAQQTEQCCKNVVAILEAAGTEMGRVVKVNVFLDDMANFAEMNGTYEKYFAHKPARSCVAVKQLPKGVPVEIECIAVVA